jgi:hypothetical protein
MNKMLRNSAVFTVLSLVPALVHAQSFAAVGTRAAGMGGAFVGMADDASAIYWNPAGLAAGAYFSLVLDGSTSEVTPNDVAAGGEGSSFLVGLAMPALGLGYYRLHSRIAEPALTHLPADAPLSSRNLSVAPELRLDTLITHHGGITLVQSLWPGVAVGTTLKLVRGIAASTSVSGVSVEEALESESAEVLGRASNEFDLDIGIMASGGPLKAGLTLRNVREPQFEVAGSGGELTLERQARAGLSYSITPDWVAAADFDLLRTRDVFGQRRDIAIGVEGRLGRRVLVRSGASLNTVEEDAFEGGASRRAVSVGGSYAARASVYVDGHFTAGNDRAGHQWGVAARFVY